MQGLIRNHVYRQGKDGHAVQGLIRNHVYRQGKNGHAVQGWICADGNISAYNILMC